MFSNEGTDGWVWIIVIFALLFGWGGNGFGGQGVTNTLSADMQRGFDSQNIMGRFDLLSSNLTNATYENAQLINNANVSMLNGFAGVNQTLNNGFNGVNTNINNLSHQLSECCCALKTQMLQDKYDAVQNQLNLAEISSANAVQTQNILGQLGKWYSNPPINPYYVYGGTTIS